MNPVGGAGSAQMQTKLSCEAEWECGKKYWPVFNTFKFGVISAKTHIANKRRITEVLCLKIVLGMVLMKQKQK